MEPTHNVNNVPVKMSRGKPKKYHTEEERKLAKLITDRAAKRRSRARKASARVLKENGDLKEKIVKHRENILKLCKEVREVKKQIHASYQQKT